MYQVPYFIPKKVSEMHLTFLSPKTSALAKVFQTQDDKTVTCIFFPPNVNSDPGMTKL